MNYEEAKRLAIEWTKGQDVSQDGWRSVIAVLLDRISKLEGNIVYQHDRMERLTRENDALSLDLGIRDADFRLPDQPQLRTIADIIKECEDKGGQKPW